MDLRKSFATLPTLETEGVDLHLGGDAYITVARAGGANTRYDAAVRRLYKPHRRMLDTGSPQAEEMAEKLFMQAHAEAVVLGWRGIELDGKELPFTRENVLLLFNELPEIWRIVREEAARFANFTVEEVREKGNGLPPS